MNQRAVIYARVSTEEQATDRHYSLDIQVRDCRDYAEKKGYEVVREFREQISGATAERPVLKELIEFAQQETVNVVIVAEVDRLARGVESAIPIKVALKQVGVTVRYVYGDIDGSEEDNILEIISFAAAGQVRNRIRDSTIRGRRARALSGKVKPTRQPPYGYEYNKETGKFVPIDEEVEVIKMIFEWYVNGDENGNRLGLQSIANKLRLKGIPSPEDKNRVIKVKDRGVWATSTVNRILKREAYIGIWYSHRYTRVNGKQIERPRDEWIRVPVEPIISEEIFKLAQKQSSQNSVESKRNTKHDYLLQSRLRCATCSRTFSCETDYRKHISYYRCGGQKKFNSHDGETITCRGLVRRDIVDEHVWNALKTILLNPDMILNEFDNVILQRQENLQVFIKQQEEIAKRMDKLHQEDERLYQLYANGVYEFEKYSARYKKIEEELYEMQSMLNTLGEQISELQKPHQNLEEVRAFCSQAAIGIENLTDEEKRQVIEILDIRGYLERGKSRKEFKITLTGFIPELTIQSPNGESPIDSQQR